MAVSNLSPFLEPNAFVDYDHPAIAAYTREHTTPGDGPIDHAMRLYYAIRDDFRYNPWRVLTTPEAFRASGVVLRDRAEGAHCIDKANLLAACARLLGIPSRLHFANVRNHIGTADLERLLGTSLLVFHGYVELHLEGQWVAATPAFNKELCEYLGVAPLPFDGRHDSIFQEYDQSGGRFMEYIRDHGTFPDIPFDLMIAEWKRYYPEFMQNGWPSKGPR
ncbi:MAG: transglutaminase family protein, partial [Deltaproteobacteria bacterium]|nr:transglutaminase family protein [Deltaproteobacteria bacterium]